MSSWTLWLILSLDSVTNIVGVFVLLFITLITLFFAIFIAEGSHDKYHIIYKMGVNFFKKLAAVISFVVLLYVVTPSTKEAFVIYGFPKLAQNQQLTKASKKLLTFTELYLGVKGEIQK